MADRQQISLGKFPRTTGIDTDVKATTDFGRDGVGAGLQSLQGDGNDIAATIKKTQLQSDSIKVVQGEGAYSTATQSKVDALDPLASDYLSKVNEIYSTAKDDVLSNANLSTPEAKAELESRLTHVANVGQAVSVKSQEASVEAEGVRTYNTATNGVLANIRRDPNAAETYVKGFAGDAANLTGNIKPDTQRKLDDAFADGVVSAKALGFADRGQIDLAKKTLDQNMGTLNPAQEQRTRYQIEAIENKQRTDSARAAANTGADISAKIADWRYNADPTAAPPVTRADLDNVRGQYVNSPGTWNTLVHQLDEATAVRLNGQRATADALNNATNHSIRNQAEADLAFNAQNGIAGKKPAELMTPEGITAGGNFARDQGYVPSVFKAQIENAGKLAGQDANTPDNQQRLASAVSAYDRINELAPNTKWGFADDKGSSVQLASSMAKSEQISLIEAARRVLALAPSDMAATEARKQAFDNQLKIAHGSGVGMTSQKWETQQVADIIGPTVAIPKFVGGAGSPTVNAEVQADYHKKLQDNFIKVGDWTSAKAATDDWVKQNYSVTQVGDRNEVVKYAPEKYFDPAIADQVKDIGSKIIDEDVQGILKKNNVATGTSPYNKSLPGYRLLADDQTAREADKWQAAGPSPDGTSTRTPVTYRIQVLDGFGNYQTINGPRYRLPTAQELRDTSSQFIIQEDKTAREFEFKRQNIKDRNAAADAVSSITGLTVQGTDQRIKEADTGQSSQPKRTTLTLDQALRNRSLSQGADH